MGLLDWLVAWLVSYTEGIKECIVAAGGFEGANTREMETVFSRSFPCPSVFARSFFLPKL
jgi:hypothetical protein